MTKFLNLIKYNEFKQFNIDIYNLEDNAFKDILQIIFLMTEKILIILKNNMRDLIKYVYYI